ncbi:hypothetical protein DF947_16385 [Pedobacter paludis]|uniref:Uncharacterized protein n=1 Tax=Pedobacter paludis TaxID=2203212 RepID=A0A317EZ82_9SPHI|nr:hypothetical protein DF947_16385 [Pedobacter paludis]
MLSALCNSPLLEGCLKGGVFFLISYRNKSFLNLIAVEILFEEMANKIAMSFLLAMTEMERMTEVEKIVTYSRGEITEKR